MKMQSGQNPDNLQMGFQWSQFFKDLFVVFLLFLDSTVGERSESKVGGEIGKDHKSGFELGSPTAQLHNMS